MAQRAEARPMSISEWENMPEDEPGELVDGRLEEEELASFVHEAVVVWLVRVLGAWIISKGGFVFTSEAKFALTPSRGRKPDVSVFLPGRKPQRVGASTVPPDIMIEVVSPTPRDERRDRVEKLRDYAAFGVRWYWLVDPELRTFEVLELDPHGRYAHTVSATDEILDKVPGCDGLTLDVTDLWAEADRLQ
jgi:Uma2 family endonuclease